jgi:AcrR family transcriptional regulator
MARASARCALAELGAFGHTRRVPRRTETPAVKPARKPRLDGEQSRLRILDAAERLFAERGYYGASVRDITDAASVRVAAVNYHFRSKEELFRDVVLRRAGGLAEARLAQLERALARRGAARARLQAVVGAFVEPLVARALAERVYRDYFALLAQVSSTRLSALTLVAEHFNAVAQRFVDAFAAVYPGSSRAARLHAYQLMLGATLFTLSANRRLDSLSKGAVRSDDYAVLGAELVRFASAGVARVLSP